MAQNDIEHTQKPTQSNEWTEKCKLTDIHCFNAYNKSPNGVYLYLIAQKTELNHPTHTQFYSDPV